MTGRKRMDVKIYNISKEHLDEITTYISSPSNHYRYDHPRGPRNVLGSKLELLEVGEVIQCAPTEKGVDIVFRDITLDVDVKRLTPDDRKDLSDLLFRFRESRFNRYD